MHTHTHTHTGIKRLRLEPLPKRNGTMTSMMRKVIGVFILRHNWLVALGFLRFGVNGGVEIHLWGPVFALQRDSGIVAKGQYVNIAALVVSTMMRRL